MQTIATRPQQVQSTVQTLSKSTSPLRIIQATLVKELRIATRYIPNLIGQFAHLGVRIAFFLLLSSTISIHDAGVAGEDLTGNDLFLMFQGGLLLMVFIGPTLWGPINTVRDDLYNGTLEFLYSNPGSRYAYYVGSVLAKIVINMVIFVPVYIFLIITSQASLVNMLMVLLVSAAILVALLALGIMVALLALLWRQVNSAVQVFGILSEMLAGAYLPVTSFPRFIQYLAYFLPHTWGYDLIRYYSFGGHWQTILPVWQEWGIIALFAIGFTLISRYLLGKAEQLAKRSGLHVI